MSLKLGITIPTYTWPDMDYRMAHTVVQDYSRRTEELGFESLTVWDHLTDAPGLYGGSWMDPLICLSAAAACTERIKLGTHILVLPLRHPVLLAKEIATLDYISGGRFFFGVGPGWSKPEFDAMGIELRERGRRTDEILDAVKLLLTEKNVSFKGEFFQFDDVTIDPMPPKYPEVWVAGGSRIPDELSPDKPYMVKTVMKRIAKHADVFTCRASGKLEWVKRDLETVRRVPEVGGPRPRHPGLRPRPGHLRGGHPGPRGGATAPAPPHRAHDGQQPELGPPPGVLHGRQRRPDRGEAEDTGERGHGARHVAARGPGHRAGGPDRGEDRGHFA